MSAMAWVHCRAIEPHLARPDLHRTYVQGGTGNLEAPCLDCAGSEVVVLVPQAERDALAARVDVLTRALRQACYDGWADGEGAMARYIEDAERAGGAR